MKRIDSPKLILRVYCDDDDVMHLFANHLAHFLEDIKGIENSNVSKADTYDFTTVIGDNDD